jgi:hypothetical protein
MRFNATRYTDALTPSSFCVIAYRCTSTINRSPRLRQSRIHQLQDVESREKEGELGLNATHGVHY